VRRHQPDVLLNERPRHGRLLPLSARAHAIFGDGGQFDSGAVRELVVSNFFQGGPGDEDEFIAQIGAQLGERGMLKVCGLPGNGGQGGRQERIGLDASGGRGSRDSQRRLPSVSPLRRGVSGQGLSE
jgi:hypothetical protein